MSDKHSIKIDGRRERKTEDWAITMLFVPIVSLESTPSSIARLEARAQSVPELMRTGFHWCELNVISGSTKPSWGNPSVSQRLAQIGFCNERTYTLAADEDLVEGIPGQQWLGELRIGARDEETSSQLGIRDLTHEHLAIMTVVDPDGREVYRHDVFTPESSFNDLYREDYAMGGWWP